MLLNSQRFENTTGSPLVILHGLLGSSRNWTTVARALAAAFDVTVLDLRNHGASSHDDSMRWSDLVDDVEATLDALGLGAVSLMGHSLGGKIAMRFACEYPGRVERLLILDIAARDYPPYHAHEFEAMSALELAALANRKQADAQLKTSVPDWAMRQFLLTNLIHDRGTESYRWQINLPALHAALPGMARNSLGKGHRYEGPTLLLCGARSNFVRPEDPRAMRAYFPTIEVQVLPEAGHNLHIDAKDGFTNAVVDFMRRT